MRGIARAIPALNSTDDPVFFDLLLKYGMRPMQLDFKYHRNGEALTTLDLKQVKHKSLRGFA